MKPGFVGVITYGNPPVEDPAGRRPHVGTAAGAGRMAGLAGESADRARDRQSHLEPSFRPRHRRHAGQFRQDGREADASGTARLAGGRVHGPRLEHQADASPDHDVGGLPDVVRSIRMPATCEKDPENQYLWRFRIQRLDAEIVRDAMMAVERRAGPEDGRPAGVPAYCTGEILASMSDGIWKKEEDGPAVWRRSVYVYRKRGLAVPDVRGVRPAGPEHQLRAAERLDGADTGADAAERRIRAAAGQAVRRPRAGSGAGRSGQAGGSGVPDRARAAAARRRSEARPRISCASDRSPISRMCC